MTKIFESPDDGKTVYEREFGDSERTLIKSEAPTVDETEQCVLCKAPTPYKITDHVDNRMFYVEGAGQLCGDCHGKVYDENR